MNMDNDMKAIGIQRYGSVEELVPLDLRRPEPGPHDLLVDVLASSVNPADLRARAPADARNIQRHFPVVLGYDVCGTVVQVGSEVGDFSVGDVVIGSPSLTGQGANAEFVVLDWRSAVRKPSTLGVLEAAVLPLAGVTAHEALVRANLPRGATILVQGGAGGVGHLQIQIARNMGCRVIATAGRSESIEMCRQVGADHVVDYRKQDVAEEVRRLTNARGVHAAFDNVGPLTIASSIDSVRPLGMVVAIAPAPGAPTERLFMKAASLTYHLMGAPTFWGIDPFAQGRSLREVVGLVEGGALKPYLHDTVPIRELRRAHQMLETGRTIGKIAVEVARGW